MLDKTACIAELSVRNLNLEAELEEEKKKSFALEEANKALKVKLENSVDKEYFKTGILDALKYGRIPLPEDIIKRNLPVEFFVREVQFYRDFVSVEVMMSVGSSGMSCFFQFIPVPSSNGGTVYKDFRISYEKPKTTKVVRIKSPKKAE